METIITNRLSIRYFKESDNKDLYNYLSDKEVLQYEPYQPFTIEQANEEALRRSKDTNFYAVCLNDTLIGNIYLAKGEFNTWELGYVFNRNYWGQGYATESVLALLDYAFNQLQARRIKALCNPENKASWTLLQRLGMRREGHFIKNVYFNKDINNEPLWQDTYQYAILKEEYIKK
ncbi:MAG: GNAT family N-acetyltransferase [Coprobacillaceae bacterium]